MKLLQSLLVVPMLLTSITLADEVEPIASEDDDLCYTNPIVTGFSIMGMGAFTSVTTPINNVSGDDITNVTIIKSFDGINMSMMSSIKIDDVDKTTAADEDEAEINQALQANYGMFNAGGMFNKGIVYRIDSFDPDEVHTIYDYSMFSFNMSKIKINTVYTKNGIKYFSEIQACDIPYTTHTTGSFDAWDTDSNITSRVIQTEVVSEDFSLVINSLNSDNDDTEAKEGIDIEYRLYDFGTTSKVTNWQAYDASSSADGKDEIKPFAGITKAYKDVRVQFKLCIDHDSLYPLSYCDTNGIAPDTSTFSTDNFAIRPYALAAFGQNQYKRAGEDFNITIKALNEDEASKLGDSSYAGDSKETLSGVSKYNAKLNELNVVAQYYTPTSSEINKMKADTGATDVSTCSNSGSFSIANSTDTFDNGNVDATLKFTETGILDLTISEKPTKEWAYVDADDTSDTRRYITPSTVTYENDDISKNILMLFVPYKLDTTATYDNTATGKTWLYMNDINTSNTTFTTPAHAAFITYKIVAKNKDGNITKNYTKTCFPDVDETNCPRVNGLKLNTTFDLFLDAKITTSDDANISLYTENNSSTAIWQPTKNLSLSEGNNSIREWISPLNFTDGVGVAKVYFNIDRNTSKSINPIAITLNDANTSTSWMSNPGSPKEFNGTTLNTTKTFYYGRTHAPRQIFTGNTGTALIYYEVYCQGSDCNKSLLQNSSNLKTSDDPRWFINSSHTAIAGNVGALAVKNASTVTSVVTEASPAQAALTYTNNSYPYKATMQNSASKWLIYDKYKVNPTANEFEVEFININDSWAGKKETNTTTNKTAADRTNRRSMW